jgi:hypothetical protein
VYRIPGFVVSSISHPSQPGLEGECSAGDIGGGDNSDSRAAIGELGGGDSRGAIGELEVLGGAERGRVELDQEHTGVRSWRPAAIEVLADAGRAARSYTAIKHVSTTSIAGKRKG